MISDSLQERIHLGDRDAFRALYSEYSRDVYLTAQEMLQTEAQSRAVVKQVFLRIYRELLDADGPIDTDRRIEALTNEEIRIQRIAAGNTGSDILQQVHTPRRLDRRGAGHTGVQQPFADAPKPPLDRVKVRYAIAPAAAASASRPQRRGGRAVGFLLIALLFLLLLWVLSGMMMSLGWIPRLDLGYTWFDRTVFCLFNLS